MQVSQSKFVVLKIRSRKIFGEIIEFFLNGLDPFYNSTQIQIGFVSWILIQNLEGFGSWAKNESCPF
jgi:hypothetical protein